MRINNIFYISSGKSIFDFLSAIIGLIIISPFFLIIALLVRLNLGKPVFFRQIRPGRDGKPFIIIKFRTMTESRNEHGRLLADRYRLNRFGRFLRISSMDELPELWNVLKGDMSIVGPRPLLMQYLDRYTPEQAKRHEVRPGLTGLAQVNGRNVVLFSKRLELDLLYVKKLSLSLDIKILYSTIKMVINRNGVIPDQDVHEVDDIGLYNDNVGIEGD